MGDRVGETGARKAATGKRAKRQGIEWCAGASEPGPSLFHVAWTSMGWSPRGLGLRSEKAVRMPTMVPDTEVCFARSTLAMSTDA
jgi:hypothetical protein